VATRHVTWQLLPDLVIGCLHQALGGNVPAEGTSCLWNLFASGGPGRVDADASELAHAKAFTVLSFHSGGAGARPGKDGLSATAFPSGVRNVPVEVTEALSPILITARNIGRIRAGRANFAEASAK
jgi:N-methylhydantoinase B